VTYELITQSVRTRFSLGLFSSYSKLSVSTQILRYTARFSCSLPQNFRPNAAATTLSKFGHNGAPSTPNSAHMFNLFPLLLHTPNSPLPNALPCLQPTFTRRTSRHCLVTDSGKPLCSPCTNNRKCSVRQCSSRSLLLFMLYYD
jgi:hypothetical protein